MKTKYVIEYEVYNSADYTPADEFIHVSRPIEAHSEKQACFLLLRRKPKKHLYKVTHIEEQKIKP